MVIDEEIKEVSELLEHLKNVKANLEIKEDDTEFSIVFKTYAKLHNAKKVSVELKEKNIKTKKGLIFTYPKVNYYLDTFTSSPESEKYKINKDIYYYVINIRDKNRIKAGLDPMKAKIEGCMRDFEL